MAETTDTVDLAIYRKLANTGPCTFDELVRRLSTYSWAQVFSAVDRLSRKGTISVSRTRGADYVISDRAGSPIPGSSHDRECQPAPSQLIRYGAAA